MSTKCAPGCECKRHSKPPLSPETRLRISESRNKNKELISELSRRPRRKCTIDCSCGRHRPNSCPPGCGCNKHKPLSEEHKQRITDGIRRKSAGSYIHTSGYVVLTGHNGHPLAGAKGKLYEHRKVLYEALGDGPHPCHWRVLSGCGECSLEWSEIHVDHVDDNPTNNSPENLVVSCMACNRSRPRSLWWRELMSGNQS